METQVIDPVQPGPRPVRRVGRASRAVLAAMALGLAVAAPVQAYTITARTNVPVLPTIYKVQGAHYDIGSPVTGPMLKPWVFQSGPTVYRVAGSGAQTVQVKHTVERWNGAAWTVSATQTQAVTINAGVPSAKVPNLSVLPSEGSGYYRVKSSFTWTSPIGAVLGSMSVSMSASTDYQCSTAGSCSVGSGWVYIGA